MELLKTNQMRSTLLTGVPLMLLLISLCLTIPKGVQSYEIDADGDVIMDDVIDSETTSPESATSSVLDLDLNLSHNSNSTP